MRIPVDQLRTGMYLHKLGGSWLAHPFVRGRFLLSDPADLQAIIDAGIKEVWIDRTKGLSPATAEPAAPEPAGDLPAEPPASSGSNPVKAFPHAPGEGVSTSMHAEVAQARRLCWSAKHQVATMFGEARMGRAVDPTSTVPLVMEIAESIERHPTALLSVARLKRHDDYTYMHSVAVCALMLALSRQLGLDERQMRLAGVGGLMHDLGKMAMPTDVLNKPGRLTPSEFELMQQHPMAGARLLEASGADHAVCDIALHHHEKVDGRGYPDGLAGEDISLLARMGAVCDVYDAVTSVRTYKEPWNPAQAMQQMATWEGHFDKAVFSAFVKSVGIYPVGSLVRLSSQRLAVVVEPGKVSLLKPKVRVFYSLRSNEPVPVAMLDLAAPQCRDSIVGPESATQWKFGNLDDLWLP